MNFATATFAVLHLFSLKARPPMAEGDFTNAQRLNDFVQRVTVIWNCYLKSGPGRVDPNLYDGIPELAASLKAIVTTNSADILDAVETLRDLSHRCACRSNGLCFITGEAGLIPRQDLHDAMENSLATLREQLRE